MCHEQDNHADGFDADARATGRVDDYRKRVQEEFKTETGIEAASRANTTWKNS
jgi:hypothetical protein